MNAIKQKYLLLDKPKKTLISMKLMDKAEFEKSNTELMLKNSPYRWVLQKDVSLQLKFPR